MPKLTAMPSPTGRNREGLFMPRLAQDAARRARDADPDPDALTSAMAQLQTHLKAKLTGDDFGVANQLLSELLELVAPQDPDDTGGDPDDDQTAAQDRRRRGMAGDRCRAWGRGGHDRGEISMAERFPDAVMPEQLGPRR